MRDLATRREADLVQQLVLVAMQLQEPRRKDCAPFMLGLVAVELADCTQSNTHAVGNSLSDTPTRNVDQRAPAV